MRPIFILVALFLVLYSFALHGLISAQALPTSRQTSKKPVKQTTTPAAQGKTDRPISSAELLKQANRYWIGNGITANPARAVELYREAAEMGDPEGQTLYGEALFEGRGVSRDRTAARQWLEKAAESHFARAEGDLGIIFRMGFGESRDQSRARMWLQRAADHGDALAEDQLGQLIEDYLPLNPSNRNEIYRHYMKAAERGSAWGCYHLGELYSNGEGVEPNSREALNWFERGADLADSDLKRQWGYLRSEALAIDIIIRNVAFIYRNGFHVSRDGMRAEQWFKKGVELEQAAANSGWAAAQVALGHSYEFGTGLPKNVAEGKKWFLKATEQQYPEASEAIAAQYMFDEPHDYDMARIWLAKGIELGSSSAQYRMGILYRDGFGVGKDYKKAISLFEQAAKAPSQEGIISWFAMSTVGSIYKTGGFGVDRDYNQALQWFLKASNRGNRWAQIEIGEMYEAGLGVQQSYQEAMSWYTKASKTASIAYVYIGRLYEAGNGVNRDLNTARSWYQKAADDGVSDGQKALAELAANAGWSPWTEAINNDKKIGGGSGAEFRSRCDNSIAKLQFRMTHGWGNLDGSNLEVFPVEVTFGSNHGNYTLKRGDYAELSNPAPNCSKIPKAVAKFRFQLSAEVPEISTWEFTYKDGAASYKIKSGPSTWSMLGQAAVQGLSDYNAARHPGSAPYPSQNPSIGASKQVGLQDEAHYCVKTGAQAEGGMAGQSGGAVLLVQNACNRAITISLCASGPTYKPHWHCSDGFGLSPGQSNFSHSYTYGWHCKSSSCGDIQVVWNAVYEDSGIQPKKPDVDNSGQDSVQ